MPARVGDLPGDGRISCARLDPLSYWSCFGEHTPLRIGSIGAVATARRSLVMLCGVVMSLWDGAFVEGVLVS